METHTRLAAARARAERLSRSCAPPDAARQGPATLRRGPRPDDPGAWRPGVVARIRARRAGRVRLLRGSRSPALRRRRPHRDRPSCRSGTSSPDTMVSGRTVAADPHDGAGTRGREARHRARLQCVELAPAEGEAEDLLDSRGDILEVAVAVESVDVFVAAPSVASNRPRLAMRRCRPRASAVGTTWPTSGRDVDHPADRAARRHPVELAVVGVHRIQGSVDRDHAVPGPVRLEVLLIRVGHRIGAWMKALRSAMSDHDPLRWTLKTPLGRWARRASIPRRRAGRRADGR